MHTFLLKEMCEELSSLSLPSFPFCLFLSFKRGCSGFLKWGHIKYISIVHLFPRAGIPKVWGVHELPPGGARDEKCNGGLM